MQQPLGARVGEEHGIQPSADRSAFSPPSPSMPAVIASKSKNSFSAASGPAVRYNVKALSPEAALTEQLGLLSHRTTNPARFEWHRSMFRGTRGVQVNRHLDQR